MVRNFKVNGEPPRETQSNSSAPQRKTTPVKTSLCILQEIKPGLNAQKEDKSGRRNGSAIAIYQ